MSLYSAETHLFRVYVCVCVCGGGGGGGGRGGGLGLKESSGPSDERPCQYTTI